MFTGIIQEVGTIHRIQPQKSGISLEIRAPRLAKKLSIGDSLAVDGVCLTVEKKRGQLLSFSLVHETISKTRASTYKPETKLNLEPPLTLNAFVSGHLVSGHVDAVGTITAISKTNEITIHLPKELQKFTIDKGSVTINGVSLTIAKKNKNEITIALIPLTLANTNLGKLKIKDIVNIEVDMVAKYLANLL